MKGDFSKLQCNPFANFTGVLHQQGRALMDQDWNASTSISRSRRQLLGRDAIGPFVAAVPAEVRHSFKVTQAHTDGTTVDITLEPGRIWLDGIALQVQGDASYTRSARYLEPPIQPAMSPSTITATTTDAVILEVWEDAFNGFQDPKNLMEPAIGGVDTTERIKLFHRLRLLRLMPGDECGNLADRLGDNFNSKGKLTVTPADTLGITGECPIELGGGYTGFEHYLYRIEIDTPDSLGHAAFKWSRFNGGLVGRGTYDSLAATIAITANDQMINHCGLTSFYFEALQQPTDGGPWQVVFTAQATLSADGQLSLTAQKGTWPGGGGAEAFFRLWDGKARIDGFLATTELENGIRLKFDAPASGNSNYRPGDYWSFPVRASGTDFDPSTWPNNAPPQGIHYHRVPLAILDWTGVPPTTVTAPANIFDCRHIFQPLAELGGCCSYTVGDGMRSHGDFSSIQEAINNLPVAEGGDICILPGIYPENILIDSRTDITIKGCGPNSHIVADLATAGGTVPVIQILGSHNISVLNVQVSADSDQVGIQVDADDQGVPSGKVKLSGLEVHASTRSAVEILSCNGFSLTDSFIEMEDASSPWPGVFLSCVDALIEHNTLTVEEYGAVDPETGAVGGIVAGRGGLQVAGTSEHIRIIDNLIQGGIGNGITLGSVVEIDADGNALTAVIGWAVNAYDQCDPCAPGDIYIPPVSGGEDVVTYQSAGDLVDIRIERNRILDMGLNGIGIVAFFALDEQDEFISVEGLEILGNTIQRCLWRSLEQVPQNMINSMGYGGISLGDVEYLVIKDNVIENNGSDHLDPICGIFVLHGEGMEISRNRIVNNGAKTDQPSNKAKPGRRGGISIVFAVPPVEVTQIAGRLYPRQNGIPAVKIHDNIVSQPLGQALILNALGPVSVLGNQFTSRGMILNVSSPTFLAATVAIVNLGMSNELYFQLFLGNPIDTFNAGGKDIEFTEEAVFVPREGLDDMVTGSYLANGNVLFNDNQCVLDLLETGFSFSFSSILIFSLDDVAFMSNQCDSNLMDDFILSEAIVLGLTCRVNNNRFKEGFAHALYSAITFGILMNTTTANQGTHCFLTLGIRLSFVGGFSVQIVNSGTGVINQQNISFWDLFKAWGLFEIDFCEILTSLKLTRVFAPMVLGQTYSMIDFND